MTNNNRSGNAQDMPWADDSGSHDPENAETAVGDVVTKSRLPKPESKRSILLGALFLMATSAIGPGFITQTATFTVKMGAAFAFAIFLSIIVDIAVQLNVWRVIGVSGLRAGELGNRLLPGVGVLLGIFVVFGGFVFNVGNVAGGGLGINAMTGLDSTWGGILTAVLAVLVFLSKKAGVALDKIVVVLGVVMILITGYVAVVSGPPIGDALRQTVLPDTVDVAVITTLIGGTVGGYITYAGAHRMIDAGVSGPDDVRSISNASITSIIVTGVMRYLLFLAILGVVAGGVALTSSNLAAEAFQHAAGDIGLRLVRRDPVGRLDLERHRGRLHLGFVHDHSGDQDLDPQCSDGRHDRAVDPRVHDPGEGSGNLAGHRRNDQRTDPSARVHGDSGGRHLPA
jgi:hypothetical protein